MVSIGFARQDLEAALRPIQPIREERVEAIAMYIADAQSECVWIVLDFMDFNLYTIRRLTDAAAEKTGIPAEHIHIVTTHNHGGGEPDRDVLSALAADCALEAKNAARPAQMRFVRTQCDKQVNIYRRKYIPELDGMTTLWYGASESEGFDTAPFVENAVQCVLEGTISYDSRRETKRPFDPFPAADSTVYAAQFRTPEGKPIGSLVRFAAHAVCCNRPGSFSSDYPYHVRKTMEREFGGISLFLNGPCGDIAPGMKNKYEGTEKVLGPYIASVALAALEDVPFTPLERFADAVKPVRLAVREGVKQHCIDTSAPIPGTEDLPARFRGLEVLKYAEQLDFLYEKYAYGEDALCDTVQVSLGFLQLGGLTLAAYPGETFSLTGLALCEAFPDADICTVTEHGRTIMYIPPADHCAMGGYETICRMIKSGEEEVLRASMIREMKAFLENA
ncbi:MAG: hypothetical protein E7631_00450 [Ruminococcaceae bacterium]|nr:hypothetical protein [Oscillospiraceae bacterium]